MWQTSVYAPPEVVQAVAAIYPAEKYSVRRLDSTLLANVSYYTADGVYHYKDPNYVRYEVWPYNGPKFIVEFKGHHDQRVNEILSVEQINES